MACFPVPGDAVPNVSLLFILLANNPLYLLLLWRSITPAASIDKERPAREKRMTLVLLELLLQLDSN